MAGPDRIAVVRLIGVALCAISVAPVSRAQSFGPPTPGVCFLSRERVLDQSSAGVAANQRLTTLKSAVEQELSAESGAIAAEANVLQIQRPVLAVAVYEQRAGALALREQSFQALEATRNDELARTRAKATARIFGAAAQGLAAIIAERGCSAVLESSGAYAVNPRMDLTTEVIQALNARLPTIGVDLEPARGR